ncbi:MAG: ATP synthase F1 subunit epsilon [Lachnospiraceae bacterium]|nr:ATP synthase F1 subunit epsilon [Lachnospiraceae bacterium]
MAEKQMKVRIISPERVFYEGEVSMIELNTTEGAIGVCPGHIPLTAIVEPGILKLHEAGGVKEAALMSGFVEILPTQVRVLAEVVEWPEEIDVKRAEEARIRAERHLADKNWDQARARAQLRRSLIRMQLANRK